MAFLRKVGRCYDSDPKLQKVKLLVNSKRSGREIQDFPKWIAVGHFAQNCVTFITLDRDIWPHNYTFSRFRPANCKDGNRIRALARRRASMTGIQPE